MEGMHFDDLLRSLTQSRRSLAAGALATVAGLLVGPGVNTRSKRKKRKPKKPKPNAFGCLEVGDPCKRAGQCCSGICQGRKGKKRCQAHGVGTCAQDGPDFCSALEVPFCNENDPPTCVCARTTANSNFCGTPFPPTACADCQTDGDCEALGFPPGSACVPWRSGTCDLCQTGMTCMAPCSSNPPDA
jgi:hypothetical protein